MSTQETRTGSEIPHVEIKTGGDHRSGEPPVRLTTGYSNIRGITNNLVQLGKAVQTVISKNNVVKYPVKGIDVRNRRFDFVVPSKIAAQIKEALQPFCAGDIAMMDERQPSGDSNGHLSEQYAGNDKPAVPSFNHVGGQIPDFEPGEIARPQEGATAGYIGH